MNCAYVFKWKVVSLLLALMSPVNNFKEVSPEGLALGTRSRASLKTRPRAYLCGELAAAPLPAIDHHQLFRAFQLFSNVPKTY